MVYQMTRPQLFAGGRAGSVRGAARGCRRRRGRPPSAGHARRAAARARPGAAPRRAAGRRRRGSTSSMHNSHTLLPTHLQCLLAAAHRRAYPTSTAREGIALKGAQRAIGSWECRWRRRRRRRGRRRRRRRSWGRCRPDVIAEAEQAGADRPTAEVLRICRCSPVATLGGLRRSMRQARP